MTTFTKAEYQAAVRTDFYLFLAACFGEIEQQAEFLPNWHIEVLAAKLQACREGRIKRLVINVPPRSLKSLAASVALPAWWLGHDPTAKIINVTYGQDLSDKLARDCRTIMTSSWFQALFPTTRLTSSRPALQEFSTTRGGFRLATSVGGVLTGRGGDVIIIDDPLKPDDALSESRRKAANAWYDGTLYTRLNSKSAGTIILIMQRLHEDDLVGHVLAQEGWEVVSFPAVAEQDEEYVVDTAFGPRRFVRRAGAALHPEREPLQVLDNLRRTMGEYNFAGQYQQAPAPLGGGMVKEAWIKFYDPPSMPHTFDKVVQSWDTANTVTELADHSVCTTWGIKDGHFFLQNVLRKKLSYPNLKRAVHEQRRLFSPTTILIEDKASGTQLIQELIEENLSMVTRYKPEGDKIMRLYAQTATFENGFVHLPREAHWLADYIHELTVFPNGRHDDQVDSTAQAMAWTKQRPPGWAISEFYRLEAAKVRRDTPAMVRMIAPQGISHVHTLSGRLCIVHDGIVEVPESDARPLCAAGYMQIEM